jgi:HK97 family phage major capsid protein
MTKEQRDAKLARMKALLDGAKGAGRSLSPSERSEFDGLETELASASVPETRGAPGAVETPLGKHALLKPEHRFSKWLDDGLRNGTLKDRRSVATDFDHSKYWHGVITGSWKDADAEYRASMQEGVSADGGYLVPSPVAGMWVDLLRDEIVFAKGQAHTVPWDSGSTLTLPVMVTDPVVQNPNEGADVYPPSADATVNRYQFVARPYSELETLSWELLEDSAIDIGEAVTMNMAKRMAVQIQADFIYGSGATTIQGFTGATGLLTGVEGGTANGTAPASATGYDYVDKGIEAVRSAKVEPDLIVTSPRAYQTYGRLKNTLNDAIRPSPTVCAFLNGENGKAVRVTTAVKDTNTVGTATADCSDLFVLDSSRIWWAIRHDFSVLSLKERFATQRLLGVMCWQRLDAVLTHAEAAYRLNGIVGS